MSFHERMSKSILSSSYKAVRSFLITLLVVNQSGINFNAATESSVASSEILWVIRTIY